MTEPILHLATRGDWEARTDVYRAPSLDEEGFIHCSTQSQLAGVAGRHFRGRTDLVLLTIDPEQLEDRVVYEDLEGLGEDYPHVYGPIPVTAVVSAAPYPGETI